MSSPSVYKRRDQCIVPFPKEDVYAALVRFQDYPYWWPPRFRVKLQHAGQDGIGNRVTFQPVPGLSVGWEIAALDPPSDIAIDYYRGPHTGRGRWQLISQAKGTLVAYEIHITPKNALLEIVYRVLHVDKMHSRHIQLVLKCLERYLSEEI